MSGQLGSYSNDVIMAMTSYQNTVANFFFSQIINLPLPYSTNCSKENLFIFRDTQYNYSEPACMTQCLSRFVIKRCGCRPIEYRGKTQNTLKKLPYDRQFCPCELSHYFQIKENLRYSFPRQRTTEWLITKFVKETIKITWWEKINTNEELKTVS